MKKEQVLKKAVSGISWMGCYPPSIHKHIPLLHAADFAFLRFADLGRFAPRPGDPEFPQVHHIDNVLSWCGILARTLTSEVELQTLSLCYYDRPPRGILLRQYLVIFPSPY
ncbi:hypothetical protein TNCV_338281 [Trichonephila clavipes]|nr:hypothetical protein TNCV_338281 [Trichonephila clavipes]